MKESGTTTIIDMNDISISSVSPIYELSTTVSFVNNTKAYTTIDID
jgi:hypothetical protein